MKLSDLRAFSDIVDAGGLTAAANRRGVTQPALSRLLRDLETRLAAQLLRRTGRGIELTPAGAAFLQFCTETLERYNDVKVRIAEQVRALPGQLRLSVPLRVGRLLILDLHRDFSERLPETRVHIVEEPSDRARAMLHEGLLDAAVTYRPNPAADRGFRPLFTEDLFAVGNPAILGAEPQTISMEELGKLPLLLPSTGRYRDLVQSAFRSAGHDLRIARELETAEGVLAFAAEGEGVAILSMSNVYQEIDRREVAARLIVNPEISREIGVQLSVLMSKHAARPVLSVIRKSMQRSAETAAWKRLSARNQTK